MFCRNRYATLSDMLKRMFATYKSKGTNISHLQMILLKTHMKPDLKHPLDPARQKSGLPLSYLLRYHLARLEVRSCWDMHRIYNSKYISVTAHSLQCHCPHGLGVMDDMNHDGLSLMNGLHLFIRPPFIYWHMFVPCFKQEQQRGRLVPKNFWGKNFWDHLTTN